MVKQEIQGAELLRQVKRVLVAHVDHTGAHLDPLGPRAGRREDGDGRRRLAGIVVDSPVGAVDADLVSSDGDLDGVLEGLSSAEVTRASPVSVVAKAKESKRLHVIFNYIGCHPIPLTPTLQRDSTHGPGYGMTVTARLSLPRVTATRYNLYAPHAADQPRKTHPPEPRAASLARYAEAGCTSLKGPP